jgi:hypothetical protein
MGLAADIDRIPRKEGEVMEMEETHSIRELVSILMESSLYLDMTLQERHGLVMHLLATCNVEDLPRA